MAMAQDNDFFFSTKGSDNLGRFEKERGGKTLASLLYCDKIKKMYK